MASYADIINTVIINLQLAPQQGGTYTPPPDFAAIIARMIAYAEARIYRRLVFLGQRAANASLTTTASQRFVDITSLVTLATGALMVIEGVSLITPNTQPNPELGTRNPYDVSSLDTMDQTWPQASLVSAPGTVATLEEQAWALKDHKTLILKPTPDLAYTMEVTGIFQPAPLSSGNTPTYITTYYEELMVAACMVWAAGHQRDFGLQADDPKIAMSWEKIFTDLLTLAVEEEAARRGITPSLPRDNRRVVPIPPAGPE